jgi:hypothetical protein
MDGKAGFGDVLNILGVVPADRGAPGSEPRGADIIHLLRAPGGGWG